MAHRPQSINYLLELVSEEIYTLRERVRSLTGENRYLRRKLREADTEVENLNRIVRMCKPIRSNNQTLYDIQEREVNSLLNSEDDPKFNNITSVNFSATSTPEEIREQDSESDGEDVVVYNNNVKRTPTKYSLSINNDDYEIQETSKEFVDNHNGASLQRKEGLDANTHVKGLLNDTKITEDNFFKIDETNSKLLEIIKQEEEKIEAFVAALLEPLTSEKKTFESLNGGSHSTMSSENNQTSIDTTLTPPPSSNVMMNGSKRRDGGDPRVIYLKNIKFTTTEARLKSVFSQFGKIVEVRLNCDRNTGKSRGSAFIEYEAPESVSDALLFSGKELDGKLINVEIATPRKSPSELSRPSLTRFLYVGNLNYNTSAEDLFKAFESLDSLVEANIIYGKDGKSRGFGYVEFENVETASKALRFHGFEVNGRPVRLDYASEKISTLYSTRNDPPSSTSGNLGRRGRGGFSGHLRSQDHHKKKRAPPFCVNFHK
eukprot:TRINITY_DN8029_c0_g1_i1.p1 TRINITY_DN8029_c0_g1~~TRINITY_DN8029_c0_g1_i1.p1  ORF type:complete len:488 (-),score=109.55 TRINITY_DN8029_c0_g1_i1:36-1499(-)